MKDFIAFGIIAEIPGLVCSSLMHIDAEADLEEWVVMQEEEQLTNSFRKIYVNTVKNYEPKNVDRLMMTLTKAKQVFFIFLYWLFDLFYILVYFYFFPFLIVLLIFIYGDDTLEAPAGG